MCRGLPTPHSLGHLLRHLESPLHIRGINCSSMCTISRDHYFLLIHRSMYQTYLFIDSITLTTIVWPRAQPDPAYRSLTHAELSLLPCTAYRNGKYKDVHMPYRRCVSPPGVRAHRRPLVREENHLPSYRFSHQARGVCMYLSKDMG